MTTPTTRVEHSRSIDSSLARTVLCRTLKLGLEHPGPESAQALFSPEGRETLLGAAFMIDGSRRGAVYEAVAELALSPQPSLAGLELSYERLFGHTLRGRVCPYETEYTGIPLFQQAQELANISGFYLAFGLQPSPGRSERADHIGYEFEFLEFLSLKEACARARDDGEMLEVTRQAIRAFLRDHLGNFGRAFARSLMGEDPDGFYGRLGRLCLVFLSAESERLDLPVSPEVIALRSANEEDVPMACGRDSDLVQISLGPPADGQ